MSRAVPRHQRDVSVEKGDIQALSTGNNCLFACTSDGSIQCVDTIHLAPAVTMLATRIFALPASTPLACL